MIPVKTNTRIILCTWATIVSIREKKNERNSVVAVVKIIKYEKNYTWSIKVKNMHTNSCPQTYWNAYVTYIHIHTHTRTSFTEDKVAVQLCSTVRCKFFSTRETKKYNADALPVWLQLIQYCFSVSDAHILWSTYVR